MKYPIVCIIDDDDIYQFTAKRTIELSKLAEKILMFSDGRQAIEYLKENKEVSSNIPDIIFLDINMPRLDGWGFLDEYLKLSDSLPKKIHINMVSSSVSDRDVSKAKKIDVISDYIVKPITIDKLKEVLS